MNRIFAYLHKCISTVLFFYKTTLKSEYEIPVSLCDLNFHFFIYWGSQLLKKKEYSVMVCYFKYLNCFWELFWHTSKQKLQCFWTWKQAVPHSYTFTEINNKTHNPFTVIHKETDSIDVTVQVQITQLERIVQSTFPPTNTCTAVISWPWN